MSNSASNFWRLHIRGVVQSVGFRPFVKNLADSLDLHGFVKNLGSEGVEIVIDSTDSEKDNFVNLLHEKKPVLAEIFTITTTRIDLPAEIDSRFEITPSVTSTSDLIAPIPPDIAICQSCKSDILTTGRRSRYPFTSCTDCGPRYSTIERLPYDRINTSFKEFPLCPPCLEEYKTSSDRRFHAQTTVCRDCGPSYRMYVNQDMSWKEQHFKWEVIQHKINAGAIIAVMGQGGTHFLVDATQEDRVAELRTKRRKKSNKPFAVMVRDLATVREIAAPTSKDMELLTSIRRPIIIIPTKEPERWIEVSPGLSTLGIMLPYTGFHHLLFALDIAPVLVMTSANLPNLPMPIEPAQVLQEATDIADIMLLHNRKIIQRIDDSVIRSHGDYHLLIRRSRGYVASPLFHPGLENLPTTLALGAEQVNTSAFGKKGMVIPTQHIGTVSNLELLEFQRESIDHLAELYSLSPEIITVDLHPTFLNRSLLDIYGGELLEIQHHLAHTTSLAFDAKVGIDEPFLAWACDGYGYGSDGQAWGGELISLDDGGSWSRRSWLQPMGYQGGDTNALYPARMLVEYMKTIDKDPQVFFKGKEEHFFRHGKRELQLVTNQQSQQTTTSLGRLLDAISILLGQSSIRTYRGEPAIKLEDLALQSSLSFTPSPFITRKHNTELVDTVSLFDEIYTKFKSGDSHKNLARWTHDAVAVSMAEIGARVADQLGQEGLGFTGGVAYNRLLTKTMHNHLMSKDMELIKHDRVPPGDAGISTGQIMQVGRSLG